MRRALAIGFALACITSASFAADAPDRAALAEEVRATEIAFARSVMDNEPELFASFLDEGAIFVSNREVTRGKADVVRAWKGFFEPDRPYFEWHPEVVELSADGTLGLSRGPWVMRFQDKDGKEVELRGLYNSIWQRQSGGGWKILFDAGCSPCPVCE
ncbi:MAG: DUF4440 domain-containing protein [Thermoanaerobaculia bacterium]